jgi:hypothetical protein
MYTYIHIYIQIYMYIHTYTNTHIYRMPEKIDVNVSVGNDDHKFPVTIIKSILASKSYLGMYRYMCIHMNLYIYIYIYI